MRMNYFKSLLIALSATLLSLSICSGLATAQQITATISGTIVDPAGSVVAGATVTATSAETGLVKTATTNENGTYTITFLAPGVYKITVSQTGFTPVTRDNIKLEVAQTAELDISLGVASAQADVTIEGGETPMLQTETSQLETTVEQKLIEDLPSSERNIFSFVNLVPGTIDTNVALGNPNSAIGSSGN